MKYNFAILFKNLISLESNFVFYFQFEITFVSVEVFSGILKDMLLNEYQKYDPNL